MGKPVHTALPMRFPPISLETHVSVTARWVAAIALRSAHVRVRGRSTMPWMLSCHSAVDT
ncbi:Uncharacterised protein [Mycobacteroides abscessus subsp. abscessus]|nr:Uncharacterised protein [Mycobacteroides abscessus subsp. abscessus]